MAGKIFLSYRRKDSAAGGLAPLSSTATFGANGALAVSPDGTSLYITKPQTGSNSDIQIIGVVIGLLVPATQGVRGCGEAPRAGSASSILQYDVGADGSLAFKTPAAVPAGNDTIAIAVTPDGNNVYAVNHDDNQLSEYSVGPGGGLTPKARSLVGAGHGPVAIAVLELQVHEHADAPRLAVFDAQLARAEERHVTQTECARGGGGELGGEIVGRGEDHAHDVVVLQPVALEHLADESLRLTVDHGFRVLVARDRAPERQQSHGSGGYRGASRPPPTGRPTAAAYSARTSSGRSTRHAPGASRASLIGPMRVRTRRVTG